MVPEAWPGIANEAYRWAEGVWDVTAGRLGLAVIYKRRLRRLRQVTIWSTAGKIAGFKKTAETILKSRLQKWGAEMGRREGHEIGFVYRWAAKVLRMVC